MGKVLDFDGGRLRAVFNREPHLFRHRIENNDLFHLDRLGAAAEELYRRNGKANVYAMDSARRVDQLFNTNVAGDVDLAAFVRNIGQSQSWVVLKSLELIPGFDALFRDIIADFAADLKEFCPKYAHDLRGYLFISSPGTLTPYHIDGEWSLLAQVKGRKFYRIYDVCDPNVISNDEIEEFYHGNFDAARHAPGKDATARDFVLEPGLALSQPRHAPHVVRVDPDHGYSMTLGLSLLTNEWATEKAAHQANRVLRNAGLRPHAVGLDRRLDLVKSLGYRAVHKVTAGRAAGRG